MLSAFPDTRAMLPSMARATLTQWILEQMQAAPVNDRGECTFRYAHVLHAMPVGIDGYAWIVLAECFESAKVEYESQSNPQIR